MDIWYSTLKWIARIYTALFIEEIHVHGRELVPVGPKIFAANHPNTNNAMLLPLIFPDRQYFWVSAQAFRFPFWGWFLKGSHQIPVAPGFGKRAIQAAEAVLHKGDSVVILPEGRTTSLEEPRRGGTGAVRLALKTQAPIIPVGFYIRPESIRTLRISGKNGADEGYFQFGGPCCIHIGKPWHPADSMNGNKNGAAFRQLTDQLMDQIRSLAKQAASWRLT